MLLIGVVGVLFAACTSTVQGWNYRLRGGGWARGVRIEIRRLL
jgi:hypothetical protein